MLGVKKILREPLLHIVIALGICFLSYPILPIPIIRGALSISLFLKGLLLFVVPWLILSGTALAFASFKGNGVKFILTLMGIVILSNFCNLMISGAMGCYILPHFIPNGSMPFMMGSEAIEPYFTVPFPTLLTNAWALIIGITSGLLQPLLRKSLWMDWMAQIHRLNLGFMRHIFVPLLPLFLMGFVLKLLTEGQMMPFLRNNSRSCILMIGFLWTYLGLWWLTACWCGKIPALPLLKNVLPPIITGFTTMSSAAALPFSIEAATKNTKDPVLANAVMPVTINFHMLGDTICIPILAVILLHSFAYPLPSVGTYLLFGACFVLNKFAGAGIPGGTIMVSLPILQSCLGFSEEMLGLITALYLLIDPITTSGNVAANNFLVVFIKKAWGTLSRPA